MGLKKLLGEFSLSPKVLGSAVLLFLVATLAFGTSGVLIGPSSASAGYITLMFLISAIRLSSWKLRIAAAGWAIAVAALGYYVGTLGMLGMLGMLPTLVALVFVSMMQGLVHFGEIAVLTRSPVNLMAFTVFGQSGSDPLPLLGGALIACVIALVASLVVPSRTPDPELAIDLHGRVQHGFMTAAGSVIIVLLADALGFAYTSWALLSFCMIIAVSAERRTARAGQRVLGSIVGVVGATFLSLLPSPLPLIAAVVCGVLCVAYLRSGKYAMFVLFLTPAILLTTSSETSMWLLGVYRIEAVCVAAAIALLLGFLDQRLRLRPSAESASATNNHA